MTASPVRKPSPEAGSTSRRDEGLAGVDPDAHLERLAADARQGVDLVDEAQAGAHGALGVVLVQRGHAEDGDHGVADVLLDGAAVGLDDAARRGVVAAQEGVDELGVVALREGGEADEVAEEGGDDAALFAASAGSQRRAAIRADDGARRARRGRSWDRQSRCAASWRDYRLLAAHPIGPLGVLGRSTPRPAPPEGLRSTG